MSSASTFSTNLRLSLFAGMFLIHINGVVNIFYAGVGAGARDDDSSNAAGQIKNTKSLHQHLLMLHEPIIEFFQSFIYLRFGVIAQ